MVPGTWDPDGARERSAGAHDSERRDSWHAFHVGEALSAFQASWQRCGPPLDRAARLPCRAVRSAGRRSLCSGELDQTSAFPGAFLIGGEEMSR